jgi:TonB family protein
METTILSLDGRVRDLLSTADRQLASQSYDAAIDTYRTALSELSSEAADKARLEVEARLTAAIQARESSRRIAGLLRDARYYQTAGRFAEAFAAVGEALSLDPSDQPSVQLRQQLLQARPELATAVRAKILEPVPVTDEPPAEGPAPLNEVPAPAAEPVKESEPARPAADMRPIEPPSFHLIEDDPSMLERPRRPRDSQYIDEPPLSILDPVPRPALPDSSRIVLLLGAVLCFLAAVFGLNGAHHVNRFSPPEALPAAQPVYERVYAIGDGVSAPVLLSKVEPAYIDDTQPAGSVVLHVEVDPSGNVANIRVVRGMGPDLNARAIETASQWQYRPGMKDGVPVTVALQVEVPFRHP